MTLKTVTKFVIPFDTIPQELVKEHWILKYPQHAFAEVHIDDEDEEEDDALTKWIKKEYPELKDQNSFFIHINV